MMVVMWLVLRLVKSIDWMEWILVFNSKSTTVIGKDPRAARPYLFSDGQNIYHRVVLVPGTIGTRYYRYYRYLQNCTHFTYSLRTASYVSWREYCKQFEINIARHFLSAIFIARYFKYRKQKTQPYLQSENLFLSIIFRGLFNIFCKLPDQL